ncbi:MAG TPA: VOC family protein [Myxococcaceae bacterium]|jgi:predicted 3-demethylubiquinone-9 3-methyltransferase (glyoxalase superfamily)
MGATAKPFLMFQGKVAEEAMRFYVSLFPDGEILEISRYGPGQPGPEGTVMRATFRVAGQVVICSDSFVKHDFTFTPSVSLFVECESEEQLKVLAQKLSENGQTFMPLGNYGFSRQFAWCADRFGVSWQLNLA